MNSRNGVTSFASVLCALSWLFLFSYATTATQQPALRVAVNSTTIESFPVFAADVPQIELVPVPNGRAAMAQLVSDAVDAATGSETQTLLNSVNDPRIRIVLTLSECRYRIVARRSAGIRQVSDLRGKRVAITANTSSHYYLARVLHGVRLSESDVRLVGMEGAEMADALLSGRVDAVSIWEPHAQSSLERVGKDAVVFEDSSAYTEHFNLNTRTDVLADPTKRLAMVRLVEAINRASARIRTRPSEAIPALAPRVGLTDQTIMAVWSQFRFPASVPKRLPDLLSEVEAWVAANQKRTPRTKTELMRLIDTTVD